MIRTFHSKANHFIPLISNSLTVTTTASAASTSLFYVPRKSFASKPKAASKTPLRSSFLSSLIARATTGAFTAHRQNIAHAVESASKLKGQKPKRNYPPILFVIGPPGAGKGTQCTLLSMEFGGAIVSTPDGTVIPENVKPSIHKTQIKLSTDNKSAKLPSSSTSSTPVSFGSLSFSSGDKTLQYSVVHVSIGALLRAEADRPDSPHAKEIRSVIDRGEILTGKLTTTLLQAEVDRVTGDLSKSHPELTPVFLIDGFPRNMDNYEHFENEMESIKGMLLLDATQENCVERLEARGQTSARPDDVGFIIGVRHATYLNSTLPLIKQVEINALKTDSNAFPFFAAIDGNAGIADVYKLTRASFAQFLQVHALNHGTDSKSVESPAQTSAAA